MIFAELLEYEDNVPSACHCKQLCIDKISEGCRTWKFRVPQSASSGKKGSAQSGGECYLQLDFVSKVSADDGSGSCASAIGWISGDTGLRLTGVEPAEVTPGQEFDLTVHGVNLPSDGAANAHTSTPPRQRIKIVESDQACAEGGIAEHVLGIRCSHP